MTFMHDMGRESRGLHTQLSWAARLTVSDWSKVDESERKGSGELRERMGRKKKTRKRGK